MFFRAFFSKFLLLLNILLLIGCATIVAPKGGPVDKEAPEVIKCQPENYSKNFNKKKVRIYFDEYVKLKDINKNIIISPPLKYTTDFREKGKSIIFDIPDTLIKNTTYTVYFGNSITDVNEGNILTGYKYVFSTGENLDSLYIEGNIKNSYTSKPEESAIIMLYTKYYDSIPYKELPRYVTKAELNGYFKISNLPKEQYKLFAIKDLNSNYLFDLPKENIAFSDTLIIPYYNRIDTSKKSAIKSHNFVDLLMFEEMDSTQRLLKVFQPQKNIIKFAFKYPTKFLNIETLNFKESNWKIEELNSTKDTLTYWITDKTLDTLMFKISENSIVLDTVKLSVAEKKNTEEKPKKKKEIDLKPQKSDYEKFTISTSFSEGKNDYFNVLYITTLNPIKTYNFNSFIFYSYQDTITDTIKFKCKTDNSTNRLVFFNYKLEEDKNYCIYLPKGSIQDIYGNKSDSIKICFSTTNSSDYGSIIINLAVKNENNYIVQLSNESDKKLSEKTINNSGKITFDNLKQGNYKIKIILDNNKNFQWNTGKYLKHIQPEEVYYYENKIVVRPNWDNEIDISIP